MLSRVTLLLVIPLLLGACGGATPDTLGGPAADSGTLDSGDASSSNDGGTATDSGGGVDGGVDCNALLSQLNDLQAKAQACCAQCDIVQCTSAVPGLCCEISVTVPTSQQTQDFETALTQYKQACPSECPAIACPKAPSGICGASGECQ
jgi:hypothetical protein